MAPPPILRSPWGGDVAITPGFPNRARPRFCGVFHLICLLLLPATARATLDLQVKAVKTESNEKEEIWTTWVDLTKILGRGKLLLGKSKLVDFDAAFGTGTKPDPLLPGAADARQFQISGSRLTLADIHTSPGVSASALLARSP
jgi:hypothetical protein